MASISDEVFDLMQYGPKTSAKIEEVLEKTRLLRASLHSPSPELSMNYKITTNQKTALHHTDTPDCLHCKFRDVAGREEPCCGCKGMVHTMPNLFEEPSELASISDTHFPSGVPQCCFCKHGKVPRYKGPCCVCKGLNALFPDLFEPKEPSEIDRILKLGRMSMSEKTQLYINNHPRPEETYTRLPPLLHAKPDVKPEQKMNDNDTLLEETISEFVKMRYPNVSFSGILKKKQTWFEKLVGASYTQYAFECENGRFIWRKRQCGEWWDSFVTFKRIESVGCTPKDLLNAIRAAGDPLIFADDNHAAQIRELKDIIESINEVEEVS